MGTRKHGKSTRAKGDKQRRESDKNLAEQMVFQAAVEKSQKEEMAMMSSPRKVTKRKSDKRRKGDKNLAEQMNFQAAVGQSQKEEMGIMNHHGNSTGTNDDRRASGDKSLEEQSNFQVGAYAVQGVDTRGQAGSANLAQQQPADDRHPPPSDDQNSNNEAWDDEMPVIKASVVPSEEELENQVRERILQEAVEAQVISEVKNEEPTSTKSKVESTEASRQKNKKWLWILLVVILVAIVAVGGGVAAVLVLLSSDDDGNNEGNTDSGNVTEEDGKPVPGTPACEEDPVCRRHPDHVASPNASSPTESPTGVEDLFTNEEEDDTCQDDSAWIVTPRRDENATRACQPFVGKEPVSRCSLEGKDGRLGIEACPRTCGTCT